MFHHSSLAMCILVAANNAAMNSKLTQKFVTSFLTILKRLSLRFNFGIGRHTPVYVYVTIDQ